MTSKNDITGDDIKTKSNSALYREGWDRIFGKKVVKIDKAVDDYNTEEIQPIEVVNLNSVE